MPRRAPAREHRLYPQVGRFLRNRGWRVGFRVRPRPGSHREFDIVGVKPRRNLVVVVEAKLRDYRRTMTQALGRLYVADIVYISFPAAYARDVLEKHAAEMHAYGMGLLALDGGARELVSPRQSDLVDSARRAQLIAMVHRKGSKNG